MEGLYEFDKNDFCKVLLVKALLAWTREMGN